VGTTALIARFIGAKQYDEANATLRQSLMISAAIGAITSILIFVFAEPLVLFMGAKPDALQYSVTYIRIICLGLVPQMLGMCVTAVLRGAGDTKTPMRYNIIANCVNVGGNYLLIMGHFGFPRWGVFGAGLATTLSRVVSCVLLMGVIFNGKAVLHVSLKDRFAPRWDLIGRIINVGIPAMGEQLVMRFGNILFTKTVAGLGTITYAAHQIANNIMNLSFTPGQGFSQAATSLVGRSLGQKRPEWAEQYGWQTRYIGTIVAGTMAAGFFFFGPSIARLYTSDPDVIAKAALALKVIAVVQFSQSTQVILAGALRGAGDTRWPLISTMIGVAGVRVILAMLFINVFHFGLIGAWLAMAIDQMTRSVVIVLRYRTGRWKTQRV
ncbi:MAG: MATE family efflux transporter, partial [Bacillota bacterium]